MFTKLLLKKQRRMEQPQQTAGAFATNHPRQSADNRRWRLPRQPRPALLTCQCWWPCWR
jgi:hypothetical protein